MFVAVVMRASPISKELAAMLARRNEVGADRNALAVVFRRVLDEVMKGERNRRRGGLSEWCQQQGYDDGAPHASNELKLSHGSGERKW